MEANASAILPRGYSGMCASARMRRSAERFDEAALLQRVKFCGAPFR